MAKTKYITRTMKSTEASILCLDIETAEACNKSIILAGTYKSNDTILKDAHKILDDARIKAVSVSAINVIEGKYRMSEATFLANAEQVK